MTMIIQDAVDALPSSGGRVFIPAGDYKSQGIIRIGGHVWLDGEGAYTVLGGIATNNYAARTYRQRVTNLVVANYVNGYIGIDFRKVTNAIIQNVVVEGSFSTGILFADGSEINRLDHVIASGTTDGLEIEGASNQITVTGGKFSAPKCVQIINSNGTSLSGTSLEAASGAEFIKRIGNTEGTHAYGVRCETPSYGPVWLNGKDGSW